MSWKISGQVWEIKLPANKLIVMLALADHADHEGNNVFPSISLVAWKTGYSERQVQRIIKSLIKDGLLEETKRPGQTTLYSINLSKGMPKEKHEPSKTKPRQNVTPDTAMSPHPRHNSVTPTPDIAMSPEQSNEPSSNQKKHPPEKPSPADVDAAVFDTPMQQVVKRFETRGVFVPLTWTQAIDAAITDDGLPEVLACIDIALQRGKPTWSYVEGVLRNRRNERALEDQKRAQADVSARAMQERIDAEMKTKLVLLGVADEAA